MEKTLSAAKQALLAQRLRGASPAAGTTRTIPPRSDPHRAPLSPAQRQMWVTDQRMPGNPAANLPYGYRLRGPLDQAALETAFNTAIARHEVLRTTFEERDGEPIQRIHPQLRIAIEVTDLAHLPAAEREARLQRLASEEATRPFELARLPLVRVSLFVLSDAEHVLIVNLHHIVSDGLSAGLLMAEVDACYEAVASGRSANLPPLAVQYGDFAQWVERRVAGDAAYAEQLRFWRRQFERPLPALALPADHARPARKSFRGSNVFFDIPPRLTEELKGIAQRERCTVFMTMLAAFQALLGLHGGAEDLVVVTPVATRPAAELQPLIGDFLNLLPLRCDLGGDPSFLELLHRSRDATLDAFSNGDVPLEVLLQHAPPAREEGGGSPIFPVMLQMLPTAPPRLGALEVECFDFDLGFAQLDLSLHLYERAGGYRARLEYCTDLFGRHTAERLASNFQQLLCAFVTNPGQRISQVRLDGLAEALERRPRPVAPAAPAAARPLGASAAPRTRTETMVIDAFRDLLARRDIGIHDDFFALGGHSLAAARLMLRLRRASGLDLPLRLLFERPTVQRLAEGIDLLAWAAAAKSPQPAGQDGARVEIEL